MRQPSLSSSVRCAHGLEVPPAAHDHHVKGNRITRRRILRAGGSLHAELPDGATEIIRSSLREADALTSSRTGRVLTVISRASEETAKRTHAAHGRLHDHVHALRREFPVDRPSRPEWRRLQRQYLVLDAIDVLAALAGLEDLS